MALAPQSRLPSPCAYVRQTQVRDAHAHQAASMILVSRAVVLESMFVILVSMFVIFVSRFVIFVSNSVIFATRASCGWRTRRHTTTTSALRPRHVHYVCTRVHTEEACARRGVSVQPRPHLVPFQHTLQPCRVLVYRRNKILNRGCFTRGRWGDVARKRGEGQVSRISRFSHEQLRRAISRISQQGLEGRV